MSTGMATLSVLTLLCGISLAIIKDYDLNIFGSNTGKSVVVEQNDADKRQTIQQIDSVSSFANYSAPNKDTSFTSVNAVPNDSINSYAKTK
jgi:hypothetical protein